MSGEDENYRILRHDENVRKMGGEMARYLTLKDLCEKQQRLIRQQWFEIGVLKSELSEAVDLKEMWRDKYFEIKKDEEE